MLRNIIFNQLYGPRCRGFRESGVFGFLSRFLASPSFLSFSFIDVGELAEAMVTFQPRRFLSFLLVLMGFFPKDAGSGGGQELVLTIGVCALLVLFAFSLVSFGFTLSLLVSWALFLALWRSWVLLLGGFLVLKHTCMNF